MTIKAGPIICPVCGQEGFVSFIRVTHGSGAKRTWHYISEDELCYALTLSRLDLLIAAVTKALDALKNLDPKKADELIESLAKIIESYKKK